MRIRSKKRRAAGQGTGDRYSKEQVTEALEKSMGKISLAAKKLRCHYTCLMRYIERYPELEKVIQEVEESHLDMAESKLLSKIKSGNLDATKFFLKTKGKGRGYTERQEITGAHGKPFGVSIQPAPGVTKEDMEAGPEEEEKKEAA